VASLGALLDRYRASLYARGLACLRRPEDAADAVQETFLLALTRLSQVRDPEAVGGWLHSVMRSVCAMESRRATRRVTVAELGVDVPAVDDAVEQLALRDWVWTALEDLAKARLGTRLLAESGTSPRGDAGWTQRVRDSYLSLTGQDPEPYAAMFASGTEIATSGLVVQGRDQIRQMCEQDLADGIGTRLVDVLSSAAITVIEAEWVSPPDDPQHCPPGVTQVLFHDGTDQVRRSLGYFHGSPVHGPA